MVVYNDVSTDRKIMVYDKGIDKTLQNNLKHEIYDYASFQLKNRVGDIIIPKIDFKEPLALECQHFIDCILKKEKPITDGISGMHVVDILEKAQKNLDQSL
ncbi:oxidoreductase [Candidatus Magnetomorum sp. HK-1]|nr:oxidoreductase [Candidatus Magnetomorum sp. HK-1]